MGSIHPELALTLNDYAVLYARQDRYSEAEPLYQRALQIRAQGIYHQDTHTQLNTSDNSSYHVVLGTDHPDYAQSLNNMGSLYQVLMEALILGFILTDDLKIIGYGKVSRSIADVRTSPSNL